eukprot:29280-Eustigmatos_ZCMA.PRE.1
MGTIVSRKYQAASSPHSLSVHVACRSRSRVCRAIRQSGKKHGWSTDTSFTKLRPSPRTGSYYSDDLIVQVEMKAPSGYEQRVAAAVGMRR